MGNRTLMVCVVFALAGTAGFAGEAKNAPSAITATEIASRNAVARGGLEAWNAVRTLSESGKLTAGGDKRTAQLQLVSDPRHSSTPQPMPASPRLNDEAQLPFVMKMARPRKIRFELEFKGKTAIQVYDGVSGWKLRPYLNRLEVEPYTENELKLASMQDDLDGPLMNYASKGARIELVGRERVEDRDTYKLKLTARNGHVTHIWIDSETFLEAKVEGQPRRLDGKEHPVEIYYRDYRNVNGLKMPFLLETHVLPVEGAPSKFAQHGYPAEHINIDKITINPKLDDGQFAKPAVQLAANHP